MSTDVPEPVRVALERHDAFEARESGYDLQTTVFDVAVVAESTADGEFGFEVAVTLPGLDAAVAGETVAPVVEEDWFETLRRRLAETFDVARCDENAPPIVEREDDDVVVGLEYRSEDADLGVEDAKTLVEYVEGTYAQGLIPGYDYRGPAGELLDRAMEHGRHAAEDGR